jgi:hypothetical protein
MPDRVHISSEGGPLLISDAEVMRSWNGIDGSDYERACEFFDRNTSIEGGGINVGHCNGILWEMNGAGTAYIFQSAGGGYTIIRSWLSDPEDDEAIRRLASEPINSPVEIGELTLTSKSIVIMWAAENGACILPEDIGREGRPSGEMTIDDAGYIFVPSQERYQLWHDEIVNDEGMARRCHIKPI